MFVVNLAFSDLCMMTSMGLPVTINSFLADHWIWGSFLCKIYGCLGALFGKARIERLVHRVSSDLFSTHTRHHVPGHHGGNWLRPLQCHCQRPAGDQNDPGKSRGHYLGHLALLFGRMPSSVSVLRCSSFFAINKLQQSWQRRRMDMMMHFGSSRLMEDQMIFLLSAST